MKAIRTRYLGYTKTKPSRYVAETGERGQRIVISSHARTLDALPNVEACHGHVARLLCERYGWEGELIGGRFPDGSMCWVFADSTDRVQSCNTR